MKKKTNSQFLIEANLIHLNEFEYLNEYRGLNYKIKIRHKKCNHIFLQNPNNHLRGSGCPKCKMEKIKKVLRKTHEQFLIEANFIHQNNFIYLNHYETNKIKLKIQHKPCGHTFQQKPNDHLQGHGCPKCGNSLKKTHEQFLIDANLIHQNQFEYLDIYTATMTKIKIKHKICGYEFLQTPNSHLGGKGCPKCCESQGEKKISNWLIKNNLKFEIQKKFNDCKDIKSLPFDFYLPEHNICIEYDGIQHFEPIEIWGGIKYLNLINRHDNIKTNYCLDKNIKLLRISYLNVDNIDTYLFNELSHL